MDNTSVHCCSSCGTRFLVFSIFSFLYSKTFAGFCSSKEMRIIFMICSTCDVFSPWPSAATPGVSSQLQNFVVATWVDFQVTLQLAQSHQASRSWGHSHLPLGRVPPAGTRPLPSRRDTGTSHARGSAAARGAAWQPWLGSRTGWDGMGEDTAGPKGSILPSASFGPVTPPVSITFAFWRRTLLWVCCVWCRLCRDI